MIIATWNVERLKRRRFLDEIVDRCMDIRADILVLTETDTSINLPYEYCFHTASLVTDKTDDYAPTERRVSIFSRYKVCDRYETFNDKTALCVELETEKGNLLVYGTIIGINGHKDPFKHDLNCQLEDYRWLSSMGKGLCICGDFNISFADSYFYTEESRQKLKKAFSDCGLALLTENQSECIDHIAVSSSVLTCSGFQIMEWNVNKSLSDHKGIAVNIL